MIALPAINTLASNALIGTIATKLIDSVISSKLSVKQDRKKWLREKKLSSLSLLNDEILNISCENLEEKKITIKTIISRLNLLSENKNFTHTLNNYMYILEEYECYKNEIDINNINKELLIAIKKELNNI